MRLEHISVRNEERKAKKEASSLSRCGVSGRYLLIDALSVRMKTASMGQLEMSLLLPGFARNKQSRIITNLPKANTGKHPGVFANL